MLLDDIIFVYKQDQREKKLVSRSASKRTGSRGSRRV